MCKSQQQGVLVVLHEHLLPAQIVSIIPMILKTSLACFDPLGVGLITIRWAINGLRFYAWT